MSDITPRQQRILDFIAETVRDRGYPPTVREIGEAVGLTSSSSVHAQLANLERKGLLHEGRDQAPSDGAVRAQGRRRRRSRCSGASRPAPRSWPTSTSRSTSPCRTRSSRANADHFALRVAGRLHDRRRHPRRRHRRDPVAGHGARTARSSRRCSPDPAEDEATVKRLGHDGARVMLIPENPAMQPFEMVDGRILGRVVAVLRRLP